MTTAAAMTPSLTGADPSAAGRVLGMFTPRGAATAAVLGAAFVAVFHFFFWTQGRLSWGSGDWSHAFLVPLISGYLLYQRRDELARTRARTFWPGLLPVVLGISAYALFQMSGALANHMAQGWAMVLTLFGVVLLTCGPRVASLAFLPVGYLLLGITIAEKVMIHVTFRLQLIASQGAYAFLNVVGVPTTVDGNTLAVTSSSGDIYPLNVAEACSGMRMVIAFVALGVAVALVAAKQWWQRAALLILAVPVALFMNIIRVAVLGLVTLVNPKFAEGQSHMLIGTLLLIPAFGFYMAVAWALNKAVEEGDQKKAPSSGAAGKGGVPARAAMAAERAGLFRGLRTPGVATALCVLIAGAVALPTAVAALGLNLRKIAIYAPGGRQVGAIPTETAKWKRVGADSLFKEEMVEALGTQNYLSRTYVEKDPPKGRAPRHVDLHLAYYTGMIDTVPHVPDRCMTGAGFSIVTGTTSVPLVFDPERLMLVPDPTNTGVMLARHSDRYGEERFRSQRTVMPRGIEQTRLRVTDFVPPRGQGKIYVGYFFVANGAIAESPEEVRLRAFDLKDSYAYYLKIQVGSNQAQSPQELADAAASLLSDLFPDIMRCVPDWTAVERGEYPDDNPHKMGKGAPASSAQSLRGQN